MRIGGRGLHADRRCLGHAIDDGDVAHPQIIDQPPHHLHRTGRAADQALAQPSDIEAMKFGMVQHADEHRRHAAEHVAALIVQCVQQRQRVEAFAGIDDRGAQHHAEQAAADHAAAVVQRQRHAVTIALRHAHDLAGKECVVENIVVAQRRRLRRTGRAGRVLDVDRIVRLQDVGQLAPAALVLPARRGAARSPKRRKPGSSVSAMWISRRRCGRRSACNWPGALLSSSGASVRSMPI